MSRNACVNKNKKGQVKFLHSLTSLGHKPKIPITRIVGQFRFTCIYAQRQCVEAHLMYFSGLGIQTRNLEQFLYPFLLLIIIICSLSQELKLKLKLWYLKGTWGLFHVPPVPLGAKPQGPQGPRPKGGCNFFWEFQFFKNCI